MQPIKEILHHFFTPHHKNNYRAKALHIESKIVYLALIMCMTFIFNAFKSTSGDVLGYATDITKEKIYELTNSEREKVGLPALNYSPALSEAAKRKGEDMFRKGYWSHFGPDGATPWDFILSTGYEYEFAGENLAKNFMFSNGVVRAWMESPSHRENIVRPEYTEVGYAVVNGVLNGEETTLVVQMFATPISNTNKLALDPQTQQSSKTNHQSTSPLHTEAEPGQQVLAGQPTFTSSSITNTSLSPASIVFNMKIIFLLFLVIILSVDFYIGLKLDIIHIHGKNIVHMIFICFIIAGVYIMARGGII